MQRKTVIKYLRISPKKLNFLVDDLKGKKAYVVINECSISVKKGAKFIGKAVKSCLSTFEQKGNEEKIIVKNLKVDKGPNFKRWQPGGRGAAHPYLKRTSHLEVILESTDTKK